MHLRLLALAFEALFWPLLLPSDPAPPTPLSLVGAAVAGLGLALALWARHHLGNYWSGAISIKFGHRIIRTGPYGWVRHPIYAGIICAVAGSALATERMTGLLAILLVVAAYTRKIPREEQALVAELGDAYARAPPPMSLRNPEPSTLTTPTLELVAFSS